MSGGFQPRRRMTYANDGNALGNSQGLYLPFPTSAHTYGPFTQLAASTPFDCSSVDLTINCADFQTYAVIDLAIGPAGSEEVIASALGFEGNGGGRAYSLPLKIVAGTRVSARCQYRYDLSGTKTGVYVTATFGIGDFEDGAYQKLLTVADSAFVSAGSSSNTKGSWVSLSSAIPQDVAEFCIGVSNNGQSSPSGLALIDIGVGAAGAEVVIAPNLGPFAISLLCTPPTSPWLRKPIPAGMRVAARLQSSSSRGLAISMYGGT